MSTAALECEKINICMQQSVQWEYMLRLCSIMTDKHIYSLQIACFRATELARSFKSFN